MSYNGRRAPNVSQYVRNIDALNELPSAAAPSLMGDYDVDAELAMFTNTQFDEFTYLDGEEHLGFGAMVDGHEQGHMGEHLGEMVAPGNLDLKSAMEYHPADFGYPEYNNYAPAQSFVRDAHPELAPIQTQNLYVESSPVTPATGLMSPLVTSHSEIPNSAKRSKASASSPSGEYGADDPSRAAAEEDKRRRNTAASARFRVKKKQREAALERSAKEMADKVAAFEARISTLEMENTWLKNLITEKNETSQDINTMYKKYIEGQDSRKGKDGVGTKA